MVESYVPTVGKTPGCQQITAPARQPGINIAFNSRVGAVFDNLVVSVCGIEANIQSVGQQATGIDDKFSAHGINLIDWHKSPYRKTTGKCRLRASVPDWTD